MLGRCLLCLCFLDHLDDAGNGRVCSQAGYAHRERPLPVDRPGVHLLPRDLVHGHALAGNGGLVHGRLPGQHQAIHGDPLAGADQDAVADTQLLHPHLLLLVAMEHRRPSG